MKRYVLLVLLIPAGLAFSHLACSTSNSPTGNVGGNPTFTPVTIPGRDHSPTSTPTPSVTPTGTWYTQTPTSTSTLTGTPTQTLTPTVTPTGTLSTPTPTSTLPWAFLGALGQFGTGGANGNFELPVGVAVGDGFVAVSDNYYGNIQIFDDSGNYLYRITPHGGTNANLFGLAIDSYGELYSADNGNGASAGEVDGYILGPQGYSYDYTWTGHGNITYFGPTGVKIDANGNLVVADYSNETVWNLSWTDDSILNQSSGGPSTFVYDVALDSSGNIYATDCYGQVDKYANNYTYQGSFSGSGWAQPLGSCPDSLAVDSLGNLFISDTANGRVVYADNQGNYLGEIDGFAGPYYLVTDSVDDLFVADGDAASFSAVEEFVKQ